MNFAETISKQSKAVIVIVVLLCAAGLLAALRLPTAIFPNTNFPRIVVTVENGETPADQMLVTVTQPIEEAMNGIPGIQRIKSTTARGSAEVNLFFDWNSDIIQTQQIVQGRLAQLALPQSAQITHIDRLTFAVFPVIGYSLTSDKRDTTELRELAAYNIRPRLTRLTGVADVQIQGGSPREYQIQIYPSQLAARNVTIPQVTDAIRNSNVLSSPGLIEENHQLELALISGQAANLDDLRSIVVANINGASVRVSDIAAVREAPAPNYTIVTADGNEAVLFNVLRQPDANTVSVTDEVKTELAQIQTLLPKDVKVTPFYDQSLMVSDSIRSVRDAIIIGLLLSVFILYIFLRNIGTTLVAITVIPVTILVTFLAMYLVGLSFDLMTLGGVAAAIGLVIDDAIVVVENIYTHMQRGESPILAVQKAITEITVPIIGSTITPVVVFLPLTLLTGVTGVFFRSLALTMAVALLTSLVLALTFTPVLAERFVKVKGADNHEELGRVMKILIKPYESLLRFSLRHRLVILIVCFLTLAGSYILYRNLGSEFLPSFDEGAFVLDYIAPAGTSLEETDRVLKHVEELLKETPEVESYSRRTGLQLGLSITEPNTGDFLVKLKSDRARSTATVIDDLRGEIENSEPSLEVEFVGILSDLVGDLTSSPEPIEIKIFSEDKKALHAKAEEVESVIKDINGVVDTNAGVIVSGPAVTFKIDPMKAANFGVTASDVSNAVETAMNGTPVSSILHQGRSITVRVTLPENVRRSIDVLQSLPIRSSSGNSFRLDQIATIEYDKGQTEVDRDGLRQTVGVTARITSTDLGSAISSIKSELAAKVKLPAGMTIEYGGLFAEQQSSFRELALALVLAILLVFLVLLVEFRSFTHPIAIVAGAVLALGGVLLALFITGTTLNVVSLMGMIMVVGIVAKNGILMLDAVEEHLATTNDVVEALLISGRRRFRPVLMTSIAAILGMLPLALAIGSGSEMLQPLAIAVIGGLIFALLLSLVVTPTIYALLRGTKRIDVTKI